jgi:hypothetical protein
VVANAQPFWSCLDGYMRELTLPFLEPERAGWQYPWASLRRAGAVLAFGSDWTVSTANPLEEIEVACAGSPRRPRRRAVPARRAGRPAAALAAFTSARPTPCAWRPRPARSPRASWPTWPSWTATRSTRPPAPSARPGPGHPGRGRAGPRRPVP